MAPVTAIPAFLPSRTIASVPALCFLPLGTLWTTNPLSPVAPVADPCPRFPAGCVVHNPPAIFGQNGYLNVRFSYQTRTDTDGRTLFSFMTPEGLENPTPTLYSPNNPPSIVTTQGSVEDWTIENRTLESHEFHLHQTHFLVLSQDDFEVNGSEPDRTIEGQYLDMIQVPYWDGNPEHPYPRVTVQVDFRGPDIGDLAYHCHIAEHEDGGMMAIIRVQPPILTGHSLNKKATDALIAQRPAPWP